MKKHIFNDNKLVIASHNEGKVEKIKIMLKPLQIEVLSANDFNLKEPIEDGNTFEKNALIKSSYVCKKTGIPSLSDDSGICFCDLNNEPGIYSARWAKKYGSFSKAMQFILKKMKKKKNRSATFVCSLAFKYPEGKMITVVGKIKGSISHKMLGTKGFGYDPIFIPHAKSITFGQMIKSKKINMDHRCIAFRKLKKKIKIL